MSLFFRPHSHFKSQIPRCYWNHQGTCICYFRLSTNFIHRRSLLTCTTTYHGYSISRGRDNQIYKQKAIFCLLCSKSEVTFNASHTGFYNYEHKNKSAILPELKNCQNGTQFAWNSKSLWLKDYRKVASTNASRFEARLVYMHTQNDIF